MKSVYKSTYLHSLCPHPFSTVSVLHVEFGAVSILTCVAVAHSTHTLTWASLHMMSWKNTAGCTSAQCAFCCFGLSPAQGATVYIKDTRTHPWHSWAAHCILPPLPPVPFPSPCQLLPISAAETTGNNEKPSTVHTLFTFSRFWCIIFWHPEFAWFKVLEHIM